MSISLEKLANYVREVRKQKNLSQSDVAKRGGPSAGWIGGLEAGTLTTIPKQATLEKLARGLGVEFYEVRQAAGSQIQFGFLFWLRDALTAHGVAAVLDTIHNSPNLAQQLKAQYQAFSNVGLLSRDPTDWDERHRFAVETLVALLDGEIDLSEVDEERVLAEIHPIPQVQRIPTFKVQDLFPEEWRTKRPDDYTYLNDATGMGDSIKVAFQIFKGRVMEEWGYQYTDIIYLGEIRNSLQDGDTLLVRHHGEQKFVKYRKDELGEYLEVVSARTAKKRIPLNGSASVIAQVFAEYRHLSEFNF
jgi:transcriptional regulator with XRE-family HTH domain